MTRAVLVGALAVTACSVPEVSLEGKQCPCTDGYVCDTLTNRCLMTNDGGTVIDSPAATQCLPVVAGENELYRYSGTFDWQVDSGTWAGDANEITQTSTTTNDAYAYKTAANITAAPDYRVVATMRSIAGGSGSPSLGIVLRAALADNPHYSCDWIAKNRELKIVSHGSGGATTLGSALIGPAVPLPASFTMEASVDGTALACCIREIATATLSTTDAAMSRTNGYPGLTASRMQAGFGSFVVLQRP